MRRAEDAAIMSAKAIDGIGTTFDVDEYDEVVITLIGYNSPDLTAKIQGYDQEDEPDFSAAADDSNPWAYKYAYDEDIGSGVQGSTGVPFTGSDAIYELKVNTDLMKYLNVEISSYVAGNLTVHARGVRRVY